MTFNISKQICEIAKYNNKFRIRLAGLSDLIASEAKYHLACFRERNLIIVLLFIENNSLLNCLIISLFCEPFGYDDFIHRS